MSERTVVDLIEEWQTGAAILVGLGVVSVTTAAIGGQYGREFGLAGLIVGPVVAFLAISYVLYG